MNIQEKPGRKRQGRKAAIDRKNTTSPAIIAGVRRMIPTYELLSEEGLNLLEDTADTILQEAGIEFRGDRQALQLWRDAGTDVKGERVGWTRVWREVLSRQPRLGH